MLSFTCGQDVSSEIQEMLVSELTQAMKDTELQTLAGCYYDSDLAEKLRDLIVHYPAGFDFDPNDQIGEEPYGMVYDFYEAFSRILKKIKEAFPNLSMEGYIFVNYHGSWSCVYREAVYTTEKMKTVQFTRQLQCVQCKAWMAAKAAHTILSEEEYEEEDWDDEPQEP